MTTKAQAQSEAVAAEGAARGVARARPALLVVDAIGGWDERPETRRGGGMEGAAEAFRGKSS